MRNITLCFYNYSIWWKQANFTLIQKNKYIISVNFNFLYTSSKKKTNPIFKDYKRYEIVNLVQNILILLNKNIFIEKMKIKTKNKMITIII